MPAFTPQLQSITALWLVLIFRPAQGRRLSGPGWLGEILRWFVRRRWSPIPIRNRARRRVTSLIRPTTLPLRHAATTQLVKVIWQQAASPRHMEVHWCSPGCASVHPAPNYMVPWAHSQTASRSVQPFLHSSRQSVPILYNGPPFLPTKFPLPVRDLVSRLLYGSLGPPKSSTQAASRSVQLFLQGSLLWQTDRPTDRRTDHATRSVTIGRICVRSKTMRPINTNGNFYGAVITARLFREFTRFIW